MRDLDCTPSHCGATVKRRDDEFFKERFFPLPFWHAEKECPQMKRVERSFNDFTVHRVPQMVSRPEVHDTDVPRVMPAMLGISKLTDSEGNQSRVFQVGRVSLRLRARLFLRALLDLPYVLLPRASSTIPVLYRGKSVREGLVVSSRGNFDPVSGRHSSQRDAPASRLFHTTFLDASAQIPLPLRQAAFLSVHRGDVK